MDRCAMPRDEGAQAESLRDFQDRFARALIDPDDRVGVAGQPGFAVYRNTVIKGCADALVANHAAVTRLVGDEWMRAAATVFVREQLPSSPMLLDYGASFADFLAAFPPAADLPYLADVARLDRLWTEAHGARDDAVLALDALSALAPEQLGAAVLRPHASARWAWFASQPIFSIWSRNKGEPGADEPELAWQGEGALLVRPLDEVVWLPLSRGEVMLLDTCAAGHPLADAAAAALDADASLDLMQTMARLFTAGAFAELATVR